MMSDAEQEQSGVGDIEEEEQDLGQGQEQEQEQELEQHHGEEEMGEPGGEQAGEEEVYTIQAGPPRTPVDDAAAELNSSLDISSSDQSAEYQTLDLTCAKAVREEGLPAAEAEAEVEPEAVAEAEADAELEGPPPKRERMHTSPISEDYSNPSRSSTSSSSGDSCSRYDEVSEGEVEVVPEQMQMQEEIMPEMEPAEIETVETDEPADPELDEDMETEDVPSPNTVVCMSDIDDLSHAPTKAIITEVVTIPAPLCLKLPLGPPAPPPPRGGMNDIPDTPASPTGAGAGTSMAIPSYLGGRYVYDRITELQQSSMFAMPPRLAPRDPRQRIMPPPMPIGTVLSANIETISDDSNQGEESSSEEEEEEDDDCIAVENDSTSGEATAATADPMLQKIDISEKSEKIYYIRRDDGTVHAGQVLQVRSSDNSASPDEYYVHYVGLNKRLDGWVGRHRISDNAEDLGGVTMTPQQAAINDQPGTSSQMLAQQAAAAAAATAAAAQRPKRAGNKDYYLSKCETNRYDYSDRKMTRYQKRRYDEINHVQKSHTELTALEAALEKEHESITKVRNIDKLQFGNYEIDPWYYSPFPGQYGTAKTLYVCEYCLKYMSLRKSYAYHQYQCEKRRPPGREIYRKGNISIFEVNGKEEPLYCQLLCLMAKLFLDHKVLYFDMDPFFFYILCETDREGSHIVGYFSKEKKSLDNNNVACILVLPPHQRKGFGKLLIAFSYVLSRKEGVIGSPEMPLSDLGRLSYRSYWAYTLLELMKNRCSPEQTTIKELSEMSGITHDDIIYTLQSMAMIKYWKGQNVICVTAKTIHDHLQLPQFKQPKLTIDLDYLAWKPHNTASTSRLSGVSG
ncbi:uncharacterized protein Dana_GF21061 [Drosophila ananassae]|uniref:Histone acetyltransferase n=1 Tax=Drosophila ananassae TaxID=7217 RepID=B3MR53_DROAN|nr:males-absent on the first protein [Drosophila ananassae]EDV34258.2 uncharacterized protein Dana_GF21061 [Drosophila ananassae]